MPRKVAAITAQFHAMEIKKSGFSVSRLMAIKATGKKLETFGSSIINQKAISLNHLITIHVFLSVPLSILHTNEIYGIFKTYCTY